MLNFELDGDLGPGASTSESRSSSRCPGLRGKLNIKNAGHAVRRPTAAYPSRCRGKSETHISHCHLRVGPQRCQGCLRKGEEKVVPRTSRRQDSPTIAKSTFYPLITKNIRTLESATLECTGKSLFLYLLYCFYFRFSFRVWNKNRFHLSSTNTLLHSNDARFNGIKFHTFF